MLALLLAGLLHHLANELADSSTHHVHAHHRAVHDADQFDEALSAQDLTLAVAAQVVLVRRDVFDAVALLRLRLGQTHGGNFGLAVGDAGNAGLVDDARSKTGQFLGDEDALLKTTMS